jgi:hypothetical protein
MKEGERRLAIHAEILCGLDNMVLPSDERGNEIMTVARNRVFARSLIKVTKSTGLFIKFWSLWMTRSDSNYRKQQYHSPHLLYSRIWMGGIPLTFISSAVYFKRRKSPRYQPYHIYDLHWTAPQATNSTMVLWWQLLLRVTLLAFVAPTEVRKSTVSTAPVLVARLVLACREGTQNAFCPIEDAARRRRHCDSVRPED